MKEISKTALDTLLVGRIEYGVLIIEDFRMQDVHGAIGRTFKRFETDPRIYKIFLYVPAKNIETIKLLLKEDFKIEGVHPRHFEGLNYISMGKVLRDRKEVLPGPEFSMDQVIEFYAGGD